MFHTFEALLTIKFTYMDSDFIKSVKLIAEFNSYEEFSESEYSKYPSISVSKLKKIKKSPLHYKEEEYKESPALVFGNAYHCYLLEPKRFEEEYYIIDDKEIFAKLQGEGIKSPRSTKKYKDWLAVEHENAGDKNIISSDDLKIIKDMAYRINSHPYAKTLISKGIAEKFLFVLMEDKFGNEYYIKLIVDYMRADKRIITDLKTCVDASLDGFTKDAAKYNYHLQSALYADIIEHLSKGKLRQKFFFLAQEKARPYAFNIFEAGTQFISQGRYEYEMLLMLYKQSTETGNYPGYQVWCENRYGINELKLPPWAIKPMDYFNH